MIVPHGHHENHTFLKCLLPDRIGFKVQIMQLQWRLWLRGLLGKK